MKPILHVICHPLNTEDCKEVNNDTQGFDNKMD